MKKIKVKVKNRTNHFEKGDEVEVYKEEKIKPGIKDWRGEDYGYYRVAEDVDAGKYEKRCIGYDDAEEL